MRVEVTEKRFVKMNIRVRNRNATTLQYRRYKNGRQGRADEGRCYILIDHTKQRDLINLGLLGSQRHRQTQSQTGERWDARASDAQCDGPRDGLDE